MTLQLRTSKTGARTTTGWRSSLSGDLPAIALSCLGATAAAATIATLLYLLDQQMWDSIGARSLAAWWWYHILAFYCLPVSSLVVLLRIGGGPSLGQRTRVLPPLVAGIGLLSLAVLNSGSLARMAALPTGLRFGLTSSLVAACVCLVLSPLKGRSAWSSVLGSALGSVLLLFTSVHNGDSNPDLHRRSTESLANTNAPAPKLLILGLDGADWSWIEAMFARGELPNLHKLRGSGAWGRLATIRPTLSPLVWTTMITGRTPEEHGIRRIQVRRPRGFEIGAQGRRMGVRGMGLPSLQSLLARTGRLVRGPVTGSERRVPAIWNILTFADRPVSVVSWWATWPAEPVLGLLVSDRVYYDRAWARGANDTPTDRLTFPAGLAPRMRRLVVRPDDIPYEDARRFLDVDRSEYESYLKLPYSHHEVRSEFRLYLSMFESDRRFSREALRESLKTGGGAFFALFRLIDLTSHCCLKYSSLAPDHLESEDEDLARFHNVTEEAYREVDALVGELLRDSGYANVVLLSDHGFRLERTEGRPPRYDHDSAPPGIFLGTGPAFRPGPVEDLSVYDVMPLLLYLEGLPIADDMRGKLPERVLDPRLLRELPPRHIASYDFVPIPRGRASAFKSDDEILKEFRALGYIN